MRDHGRASAGRRATSRRRRRARKPVALALEGVGRQRHALTPISAVERGPVDLHSGDPELRQALEHLIPVAAPRPQRRRPGQLRRFQAPPPEPEERRPRPHLEARLHPERSERRHRRGELDRLPYLPHPVLRPERPGRHRLPRHRRHPRHPRRPPPHRPHHRPERPLHRPHQPRVKRVRHPQPLAPDPRPLQPLHHRPHPRRRPRHHHALRPIHRRHPHLPHPRRPHRLHRRPHHRLRGAHRRHRPAPRQRPHQPPPRRHHPRRRLHLHHPRHARRRVLPHAVSHHRRRLHPPPPPHLRQPPLHREQRHLRRRRLVHPRRHVPPDHPPQPRRLPLPQRRRHPLHRRPEHPAPRVQLPPHPPVLRPLPREQKGHAWAARRRANLPAGRAGSGTVGLERSKPRARLLGARGDDGDPVLEVCAARAGAEAGVGNIGLGPVEGDRVARRQLGERGRRLRREGEHVNGPRRLGRRRRHRRRSGFHDHVGVGPAEAEGAHPGHATPRRPRAERADHVHRQLAPRHVWVGRPEVEVRRDLVVLQGQDRLDEPGHAGRGLQMSDVRLDRAQQEAALGRPARGEDGRDRANLDRIAERRPGAVRLHVGDILGRDAAVGQGLADHRLLRRPAGRGEPRARAVLVHRAAAHHREHPVAVRDRVGEALEHDHPAALTLAEAVRGGVECLAAPVGRQHPRLGEGDRVLGREREMYSARDRHAGFAAPEALAREVNGDQRRRARGIDGEARPLQAQDVGQTAGGHAVRVAGGVVGVEATRLRRGEHPLGVVGARDADVHPGPASPEAVGRLARALERLPRDLEQETMLRVHRDRLARRDTEERGVEAVHVLDERSPARGGAARGAHVGIVVGVDVPPIARHLGHRVDPITQQAPERGRIDGPARKPAAQADHRERLGARALEAGDLRLHLLERDERAAQRREGAGLVGRSGHRSRVLTGSPASSRGGPPPRPPTAPRCERRPRTRRPPARGSCRLALRAERRSPR